MSSLLPTGSQLSLRESNRARRLAESAVTSLVTVANEAAEAIAASVGPCHLAPRGASPSGHRWRTISLTSSAADSAVAARELASQVKESGSRVFADGGFTRGTPVPGLAVVVVAKGVAVRASRHGDVVSLEVHCQPAQGAEATESHSAVA
jgi:hypothetical protein